MLRVTVYDPATLQNNKTNLPPKKPKTTTNEQTNKQKKPNVFKETNKWSLTTNIIEVNNFWLLDTIYFLA